MAKEPKIPEFVKITWDGWNYISSFIENEKELKLWLEDGSLNEEDKIYKISGMMTVKVETTKIPYLEDSK